MAGSKLIVCLCPNTDALLDMKDASSDLGLAVIVEAIYAQRASAGGVEPVAALQPARGAF